jgi:hypothetical protein
MAAAREVNKTVTWLRRVVVLEVFMAVAPGLKKFG